MTTSGHLEVLRRMLFRVLAVVSVLAVVVFCFKEETFRWLLAPHTSQFVTFRWIERALGACGMDFHFEPYDVRLISTELSAQFMTHITTSCLLALVAASPYIVFELFRFVAPALYEAERRASTVVVVVVYGLFLIGLLMSYYVLFPVSFRFLATYQVDAQVTNTITLSSYIDTFLTLTFVMGCVFQLPVVSYVLRRMGLIDAQMLRAYRSWAVVVILLVSAMITPPDVFTLLLVAVPMYGLYELSIFVAR